MGTTNLVNNFALMISRRGRAREAQPLLENNLQLRRQLHNDGVVSMMHLSDALGNYASVLEKMNRESEAEPLYREAIKINQKSLGKEHVSVGAQLNNLASLLFKTRRSQEALPIMQRAV